MQPSLAPSYRLVQRRAPLSWLPEPLARSGANRANVIHQPILAGQMNERLATTGLGGTVGFLRRRQGQRGEGRGRVVARSRSPPMSPREEQRGGRGFSKQLLGVSMFLAPKFHHTMYHAFYNVTKFHHTMYHPFYNVCIIIENRRHFTQRR